jgi:hypothetical protein
MVIQMRTDQRLPRQQLCLEQEKLGKSLISLIVNENEL